MKKMLVACAMLCLPLTALAAESYTVLFKAQGSFQEVRDMLQMSIEGQGLKITHSNMIGDMLDRTGKDIGQTTRIYENAEQFEFCSATLSRQMMEADPHSIVMCPYSVVVYTIPSDKAVYLAYRKPAATRNPALQKVLLELENLLSDIVKGAM